MSQSDIEKIKKKLNELDAKLSKTIDKNFTYLTAILQLLEDKGIADRKEIIRYLEHHKKSISKISQDVEFWQIMQQLKRKRKKRPE